MFIKVGSIGLVTLRRKRLQRELVKRLWMFLGKGQGLKPGRTGLKSGDQSAAGIPNGERYLGTALAGTSARGRNRRCAAMNERHRLLACALPSIARFCERQVLHRTVSAGTWPPEMCWSGKRQRSTPEMESD
jgi:hypothetical protein